MRIKFNGHDEILDILLHGDELSDHFLGAESIDRCPAIFNNLKYSKFIAKGKQGQVFTIQLGDDKKEYIVKKAVDDLYKVVRHTTPFDAIQRTLGDIVDKYEVNTPKHLQVPRELILSINGSDPSKILFPGSTVYDIEKNPARSGCVTSKETAYNQFYKQNSKDFYVGRKFVYPAGSYLCRNENYTEYVNSVLCASILNTGKCVNFVDVLGFSLCTSEPPKPNKVPTPNSFSTDNDNRDLGVYNFTFMETIQGGTISKFLRLPQFNREKDDIVASAVIQTVFAISAMQRIYGVQHNDMHTGNVMYQDLSLQDSVFNGESLRTADYFSYDIDGTKVYFKNVGHIIKIVDFGFASKYSSPFVCRLDVARSGYTQMPGWRDDSYDVLFFIFCLWDVTGYTSLLSRMMCNMLDPYDRPHGSAKAQKIISMLKYNYLQGSDFRPNFAGIAKHPWEYLTDPYVMGNLLTKPVGKIIELGKLTPSDYHPQFFDGNQIPLMLLSEIEIRKMVPEADVVNKKETVSAKVYNYSVKFIDDTSKNILELNDRDLNPISELYNLKNKLISKPLYNKAFFANTLRGKELRARASCLIEFTLKQCKVRDYGKIFRVSDFHDLLEELQ